MKDDPKDERKERRSGSGGDEVPERDLRYGEAFGTQRDRSQPEEGGYLDPEFGLEEDPEPEGGEPAERKVGERNLRYGEPFGTQRDRSKGEEGGYLDPDFGSREHSRPGESEVPENDEEPTDVEDDSDD